jgi:biotin transporter BioY
VFKMERSSNRHDEPGVSRGANEDRSGLLRLVLKLDAVACGALGGASLAGAPVLDDLLGIPVVLLAPVGVFLVAWAVVLWVIASRPRVSKTAVRVVLLFNLAWTVDSAVVLAAGWFPLTAAGVAFILAQAAAVVIIAAAQFYALGRAYPVRPA